jgi:hypothetical protein
MLTGEVHARRLLPKRSADLNEFGRACIALIVIGEIAIIGLLGRGGAGDEVEANSVLRKLRQRVDLLGKQCRRNQSRTISNQEFDHVRLQG